MASYLRNSADGVLAKREGGLMYIWDPQGTAEPNWSIVPAEVLPSFEPFCEGDDADLQAAIEAL